MAKIMLYRSVKETNRIFRTPKRNNIGRLPHLKDLAKTTYTHKAEKGETWNLRIDENVIGVIFKGKRVRNIYMIRKLQLLLDI